MQSRYERGLAKLQEIDRDQVARIVASLADIAPDFGRYLIEFPFGDLYSRPGADLKPREIAAIAALGTAPVQLRAHIHGALNVGCTRDEVLEVLMRTAIYAGFPAALSGLAGEGDLCRTRAKRLITSSLCRSLPWFEMCGQLPRMLPH